MTLLSICVPTVELTEYVIGNIQLAEYHCRDIDHETIVVSGGGAVRGYTQPMNQAMAAARGEYLLALNDDVIIGEGQIDGLLAAALFDRCVTPNQNQDGAALLYAPHCMMWWRSTWHMLGGLDEQFVHWASDIDIARRSMQCGWNPVQVALPTAPIHDVRPSDRPGIEDICLADLDRYRAKWGCSAEFDKHRLAAVLRGEQIL